MNIHVYLTTILGYFRLKSYILSYTSRPYVYLACLRPFMCSVMLAEVMKMLIQCHFFHVIQSVLLKLPLLPMA